MKDIVYTPHKVQPSVEKGIGDILDNTTNTSVLKRRQLIDTEILPYQKQFADSPVVETVQVSKVTEKTPIHPVKVKNIPQTNPQGAKRHNVSPVLQGVLDIFDAYGLGYNVTSGKRPGAITAQGKMSHHAKGDAMDITPKGMTYDDWKNKIKNTPEIQEYFRNNNLGILDETSSKMLKRTGGTGAHWHIGPDQIAKKTFKNWYGKLGGSLPNLSTNDKKTFSIDRVPITTPHYSNGGVLEKAMDGNSYDSILYEPHIIQKGETLDRIAKGKNSTIGQLLKLNKLTSADRIRQGRRVLTPKERAPSNWGYRPMYKALIDEAPRSPRKTVTPTDDHLLSIIERAKAKGQVWTEDQVRFVDKAFADNKVPLDVIYDIIDWEGGFQTTAKNKQSTATGLFQVVQQTAKEILGAEIAEQYKNGSRTFEDQIEDGVLIINRHIKNIKDGDYSYGRVKVNMLGPNRPLTAIIPNHIWNTSLSSGIKEHLIKGESTMADLRDMYNQGFKN